jgi:asparagine N-glycosylation enzyme membrane subunit Stt3
MAGKPSPKEFLKNNWHLIVLLLIFITALWVRSFPARFGELQALDPFYIYRVSEYVLENNWQLFENDILRAYPVGNNPWRTEYLGPIYIPAFIFVLGAGWGMEYLHFAILFPAIMGAIAVLAMYLLGSELFDRKTGLFSAFFLAMTPAYITRSSAGFFEKEPLGGAFIILATFLFIRSFKKKSWFSGLLGGISIFIAAISWGGMRYIFLLYGAFLGILFLVYTGIVILNYMFSGFDNHIKRIERFFGWEMVIAFGLTVILGYLLSSLFFVHAAHLTEIYIIVPLILWGILLVKNLSQKFGFLPENKVHYFIPCVLFLGLISIVVASMFSDVVYNTTSQFTNILTFSRGVTGSTVAENAPGNWGNIASMTSASFANSFPGIGGLLSSYSQYAAIWVFMWLGIFLLLYRLIRTGDLLVILPLAWILASFWGVFYYIRLVFLLGPPSALIAGFFLAWLITRRSRLGITDKIREKVRHRKYPSINGMTLILSAIVILVVLANFANGYVYSLGLGPSICFPRQTGDSPFEVEKCVTIEEDGSLTLAANQPWYDALNFMNDYGFNESNNIEYPPVILTWWDFGYWFQTRAHIATAADGGAAGDRSGIAYWFTSDVSEWSEWEEWLKNQKIDFILMDYTLPGKFGAISKIASEGETIYGFIQFQQKGVQPNGNQTIVIFGAGQYEVWIPMQDQAISGSPMLLIQQNGQYLQRNYLNEVCTADGIIRVSNRDDAIPGCVALTNIGVFFIPPEVKDMVFTDLMFMNGARLPVTKLYDTGYVTIYRPIYS